MAGARLGLTQAAVSQALGRVRQSIGDPLFVRAPGGLQPTARAIEIAPGVRVGLSQLRTALSPSAFDPGTADRRFTIAAGSYRSEEHTSELQSLMRISYAVFCLKKKQHTITLYLSIKIHM